MEPWNHVWHARAGAAKNVERSRHLPNIKPGISKRRPCSAVLDIASATTGARADISGHQHQGQQHEQQVDECRHGAVKIRVF